jgi:hypothetical protein
MKADTELRVLGRTLAVVGYPFPVFLERSIQVQANAMAEIATIISAQMKDMESLRIPTAGTPG